jgi:hypothetical protein
MINVVLKGNFVGAMTFYQRDISPIRIKLFSMSVRSFGVRRLDLA